MLTSHVTVQPSGSKAVVSPPPPPPPASLSCESECLRAVSLGGHLHHPMCTSPAHHPAGCHGLASDGQAEAAKNNSKQNVTQQRVFSVLPALGNADS